jgi:hypothetical protein
MAKIIKFYVPSNFKKKGTKWAPADQNGRVIQFRSAKRGVGLSDQATVLPSGV